MKARRSGFTLIELLVVVAILAILAGLLFPLFLSVREKSRSTACLNNLQQLGIAIHLYMEDTDGVYPLAYTDRSIPGNTYDAPSWRQRVFPYIRSREVFLCPSNDADERLKSRVGSNSGEWLQGFMNESLSLSYGMNGYFFNANAKQGELEYEYPSEGSVQVSDQLILVAENQSSMPVVNTIFPLPWNIAEEGFKAINPPYGSFIFTYSPKDGRTNWLFCDGRVKSLRLRDTLEPYSLWFDNPERRVYYPVENLPPAWR